MATFTQNVEWHRKIVTSRIFLIALAVHVLFVTFFGGRVLFNKYMEQPDFKADEGMFLKGAVEENAPPAPPSPPAPQLAPTTPTMPVMSTITTTNPAMKDFMLPTTPVIAPSMSNNLSAPPTTSVQASQSIGALPSTMAARGANGRAAAMSKAGGKQASELAVINALRWLQKVQNPDGTWGEKYKGAMTGFALLCYLGHGETPTASKEFGIVVTNAINALLGSGTKFKGVLTFRANIDQPGCYEHGIATYALGEAYTMTKDERIAPVLTDAVNRILKGQAADGGWTYAYAKTEPSDTSVSGWQIQALKAAKLTGLPIEGIPAALDNAMKNLDRVYDPATGSFGYRKAGDHKYTLTGVGLLCKLYWQGKMDAKLRESVKEIMAGPDVSYVAATSNLYSWYYNTQACFMVGGSTWEKWNRMFQDELIRNQTPLGNWPPIQAAKDKSLNKEDTMDGNLYRTCLCTLMLEVYYRYLPTGKEGEGH